MTYVSIGHSANSGGKFGRVARLAARQHGLASRAQLRDCGVTDASIANAVASGYLHPTFRGVFSIGHPSRGARAQMLAAVLACGEGSVVSHLSAAALLGLRDHAPLVIDVIAPGEAGRGIDGIRRHHVAPPREIEAGTCEGIPCTSPSRTVVDLAGTLGESPLRRLVERAAVLRVLDIPSIEGSMAGARRRGAPLLRTILNDWRTDGGKGDPISQGRTQPRLRSDLEARLLALVAAEGLPRPVCNRPIEVGGQRLEVDFLWPAQKVVIETDGRHVHDNPVGFERDRLRDRALQMDGYRVVRFTHSQVSREPKAVASAIRRLLAHPLRVASAHGHP